MIRLTIDEEMFRSLVKGQEVRRPGFEDVRVLLADIGFDAMRRIIDEAEKMEAR